jgi:hypothetical protein
LVEKILNVLPVHGQVLRIVVRANIAISRYIDKNLPYNTRKNYDLPKNRQAGLLCGFVFDKSLMEKVIQKIITTLLGLNYWHDCLIFSVSTLLQIC